MKLDASCMRYLTKDDYRVLTAVEMGMRNHDVVPIPLIASVAKLRHSGISKILSTLLRHKLLAHSNTQYDGYRLSYLGLDILALHSLYSKGIIDSIGSQVGVGKESDVFEAFSSVTDSVVVIKLHRLGRTSFRAVRNTRDYAEGKSKCSWLYLSRLAAMKEFSYMKALYNNQFPTPVPIDQNRHVIVMSKVNGYPLSQIRAGKLDNVPTVFAKCVGILKRLAEHGVIHCDLNEFNILINAETQDVTVIDFPQLVSITHPNAEELFTRDMLGLMKFFSMKMKYYPSDEEVVTFDEVIDKIRENNAIRQAEEVAATASVKSNSAMASAIPNILNNCGLTEQDEAMLQIELQASGNIDEVESDAPGNTSSVFRFSDNLTTSDSNIQNKNDVSPGIESGEGEVDEEASESEEELIQQSHDIHLKVKREQKKHNNGKSKSRNHTKRINKYGKVDRSLRNL